jgi:hypothetical protein
VVTALSALVLGFHLLTLQGGVGWFGDSYQYLLHAENIAEGRPYASTGYIHNPERYVAPVAYPAGFPLLLAPVLALFGASAQAILVLMTLVLVSAVVGLAYLFRHELPPRHVYGLVIVIGLQPYLWQLKHEPLSDLPFLTGVVLSLLWYEGSVKAERAGAGPSWRWGLFGVLAGVAATYAIGTRPLGVLLVPSFLVYDFVRARRLTRPFVVAAASCAVTYGLWVGAVDLYAGARVVQEGVGAGAGGEGGGYAALVRIAVLDNLGDLPRHIVRNIIAYARATFVLWHVPQPGGEVVKNALMALSLIPAGLGLTHRLRHRFGVIESFCLLYALALLPWSFNGVRYVLPLIPFYYFYLFAGLERLHLARWPAARRAARAVAVTTAVALVVVYSLRYGEQLLNDRPPQPGFEELADEAVYVYLREETESTTVVITSADPRQAVFFTRRAMSAAPRDVNRWAAFADGLGASYALVRGEEGPRLPADRFRLVASSESFELYHIVPVYDIVPAPPPDPGGGAEAAPAKGQPDAPQSMRRSMRPAPSGGGSTDSAVCSAYPLLLGR